MGRVYAPVSQQKCRLGCGCVVHAYRSAEHGGGTRVRITEVNTGRTVIVGNDAATSWAPAWSPDGRYLAFYSDAGGLAQLWVREMAKRADAAGRPRDRARAPRVPDSPLDP